MKRSLAPFGLGIALVLLAASAVCAAPAAPTALPAFLAVPSGAVAASPLAAALAGQTTSLPATPVQTNCGPRTYFCQACSTPTDEQRLCSEQICGTFVIINCGNCSSHCVPPPA
jgi:hypothetical protein